MGNRRQSLLRVLAIFLSLLVLPGIARAQGIALSGVGPVNRAMGGASTAAPVDAAGALLWNPATICGLPCSEVDFGMELLLPTERLSSSFAAYGMDDSTRGEPGVSVIPEAAFVQKSADSPWAYGLGIYGIGGFQTNYPSSGTNPILTPQPPNGVGLGRVSATAEYYQVAPTLAVALTQRLSIGFSPTLTLARLDVNPVVFVGPDDANQDTFYTYPDSSATRYHFGGGFQIGAYYMANERWHFGFCFKSPQWFEPIRANTVDEVGLPVLAKVHFDYPMILSLGASYRGIENWLFACDVRYFDYSSTAGFGDSAGFDALGAVTGLGWKSIVSVHLGAQFHATERLYLRMGYQYNPSPIEDDVAFFNAASPLIIEYVLGGGFSYNLSRNVTVSMAYLHGFENEVSGPIYAPGMGAIAGTSASSSVSADALSMGFTIRY